MKTNFWLSAAVLVSGVVASAAASAQEVCQTRPRRGPSMPRCPIFPTARRKSCNWRRRSWATTQLLPTLKIPGTAID